MGAWIETDVAIEYDGQTYVAPRMGAWIETSLRIRLKPSGWVAPRMGAWIETIVDADTRARMTSRAPHGRVD